MINHASESQFQTKRREKKAIAIQRRVKEITRTDSSRQGIMGECWRPWMVLLLTLAIHQAGGSHFRGGSISWKPLPASNTVTFSFWMAWAHGQGRGCTGSAIGQFVNNGLGIISWSCSDGCTTPENVGDDAYICRAASTVDNYEQGEHSFTYTFPGQGPFWITHQGCCWISLGRNGDSNWNLSTIVDLRSRSDTNLPNNSPSSFGKPLYCIGFGTRTLLRLPVEDADGDRVRCRWAMNIECASVCNSLPGATVDEENCTLTVEVTEANGYLANTHYAAALMLEDSPPSDITVGGQLMTTSQRLSAVPLQFLVRTGSCTTDYDFVSPTPEEGSTLEVEIGDRLDLLIYAYVSSTANGRVNITVTGLPEVLTYPVSPDDQGRNGVIYTRMVQVTSNRDFGEYQLCAHIVDEFGRRRNSRCFKLTVKKDPCGCRTTQVWTGDSACLTRDATAAATGFAAALLLALLGLLLYVLVRRKCSSKKSASRTATVAPLSTEPGPPEVLSEAPVPMETGVPANTAPADTVVVNEAES